MCLTLINKEQLFYKFMIKYIVLILLCVSQPLFAQEAPSQTNAKIDRYLKAINAFIEISQAEMRVALTEGGGLKAIEMCSTRAIAIMAKVSKEHNLDVKRTSLKIRNPNNAPDEWERAQLQKFIERKQAGEDPSKIETGVMVVNGKFRYMKAIPLQDNCLGCHGEYVPDNLMEKLKELYPDDEATGFREGDIHGAFSVTEKLK